MAATMAAIDYFFDLSYLRTFSFFNFFHCVHFFNLRGAARKAAPTYLEVRKLRADLEEAALQARWSDASTGWSRRS
jgi:hypothetical protein